MTNLKVQLSVIVNNSDLSASEKIKAYLIKRMEVLKGASSYHETIKADFFEHFNFIDDLRQELDKWEKEKANYTNRYSKYNIDLIEMLGCRRKHNLNAMCSLCGIPVKNEGKGNEVLTYYQNGDFEKIAKYCAEDVKATYLLYLNYLLLKEDLREMEAVKKEIEAVKEVKVRIIGQRKAAENAYQNGNNNPHLFSSNYMG